MVAKWKREPLDLEQFNGTRRLLLRFVCVCACGGDVSAGFGSTEEKKREKKRVQSLAKTGLGHRHVDNSWNEKKTAGVSLSCHLSGARRSYSGGFENALTELNELAVGVKTAAKTAAILIIVAFV